MDYKVEEFYFKSSNQEDDVYAKIMSPTVEQKIKGIILFCHGMCEYFDKYMEFHQYMLANGFIVCGHDMIGHGKSVKQESGLGFFAENQGYQFLIEDTKLMLDAVKKRYPQEPVFLLGHSMGSLIARNFVTKYGDSVSGLLLCGTIGPQPFIDSAIQLSNLVIKRKGERYRSRVLYKTFNDFACIGFKEKSNLAWTTSDKEELEKTQNDPKQNFIYTAAGFRDVFELVKLANDEERISKIPKTLPIFLFSGQEDPCGEKGFGIKRVVKMYQSKKIKNISLKIYPRVRHEMLREVNRQDVFKDILNWIEIVRDGEKE